jgi:hypothetical protein
MEERIQTRVTGLAFLSVTCRLALSSSLIALFAFLRSGMSSQDTEYEKCGFVEFLSYVQTVNDFVETDGFCLTFYAFTSSLA